MYYLWNEQYKKQFIKALDSLEIGTIVAFGGTTIPYGWLECNGASITQSAYPELYALIGGTLPNFKGRVLVGQDTNDSDFNSMFETGGSKYLQEHTHSVNSRATTFSGTGSYAPQQTSGDRSWNNLGVGNVQGVQTGNSGNLQPYSVVKWIIKALNSTPTMASVVNANNNSTEDTYSCDYSNKHYGGVVLFSGNTTGNITLSDSASNYSYIEVFGQKSGCYGYVKIYSPNGKQFGLAIHNTYDSSSIQQMFGRYTISGTTITKDFEVYMNDNTAPINSNDITIEKVVGYK